MVRTPHPTAMVVWLQREHCLQLGPFGPFVLGDFFLRSSGLRGHRVEAGSRVQSGGLPQGRCCVTCWLGCRANITVSLAWRSVAVITPPYPRNLVPVTVHNRLRCPRRISAVVVNIVCMFSSPKHTPLCVRVRPGDTCGARATDWSGFTAQTRVGVRVPTEKRRSVTGSSSSNAATPLGVCAGAGKRTTVLSSGQGVCTWF